MIKNTALFVLWFLACFFNSPHAEEGNDDIQRRMVYFSPEVFIAEKSQPCQGVLLSNNGILTSPACYLKALSLMDHQIEVLNEESHIIGRIVGRTENRCSGSLSNYFFLERDSDLPIYKDIHFFTGGVAGKTELAVNYLSFDDKGAIALKHTFDVNPSDEDEPRAYLPADNNLPDGAVVGIKGKLLCIVSGNRCLRRGAFTPTVHQDDYSTCDLSLLSHMANISYFFECRDSVISDCCLYYGSLNVYGTCVNPCSHQRCPFYIEVVSNIYGDVNDFCGGIVQVWCSDCYSEFYYSDYGWYPNCGLTEFPESGKDCNPKGCIPGCKSKPDKDGCGNSLIAPIAGAITGGAVLLGTAATIVGCLIYKYRHKVGYQKI